MEKIKVLYITNECHELAGSTYSLYNLIHSVNEWVDPVVLVQEKGVVNDFFKNKGIETIVSSYRRNLFNYVGGRRILLYIPRICKDFICNHVACIRLDRLLKKQDIKIVHSNSTVVEFGILLSKKIGAKHVWHLREFMDLDFNFNPLGGMKQLRKKINKADAVIAISHPIANHWRISEEQKIFVIWDAIRPFNEIMYIERKEKFFLFCCATLSDTKGADVAVTAFAYSGLAQKGYRLLMIGACSSEYRKKLDSIYTLNIEYLGYQKEIKHFMKKSQAFLMCSKHEGLGRTTVEAMFYGCPVLARRAGGTQDFIVDRINGLFFDTVQECASLMNFCVENDLSELCKNANQFVAGNFTEEVYGKKIMDIYRMIE